MLWGHRVEVEGGSGGHLNIHNNVITNKYFTILLISLPAEYKNTLCQSPQRTYHSVSSQSYTLKE